MTLNHSPQPDSDPPPAAVQGVAASAPGRSVAAVVWIVLALVYPLAALAWFWRPQPGLAEGFPANVDYGVFMLRTFAFHAGLGLLLPLAWALWRKQYRLALATAIPLLVALGPALADWIPPNPPTVQGPTLRLMHFNLLYLNPNHVAIVDEIERADTDVLLLHEFTPHADELLTPLLAEHFPHRATHPETGSFGWAIFSRLPVVEAPRNLAPPDLFNRRIIRTVLYWQDRPVALYAVHINPPKSVHSLVTQGQGLNQVLSLVEADPLPVIVCGDFNFTARHRMYRLTLEQGLRDAHRLAGWGRQSTWPCVGLLRWAPGVRIDHLFLGPEWTCTAIRTGAPCGSDHRPIVADISLATDDTGGQP